MSGAKISFKGILNAVKPRISFNVYDPIGRPTNGIADIDSGHASATSRSSLCGTPSGQP